MKLTDSLKQIFIDTAAAELSGAARRLFMARVVVANLPAEDASNSDLGD